MKPRRPYHRVTAYHREPGGLRRLDFFVDRIEAWRGKRETSSIQVLDIGCGKGNIAMPLASLGYGVVGVDYDAPSIAAARETAKELGIRAEFFEGSLERVAGRTFDVIIASEVLEHQKDPKKFLDDIKQHLADGGILLLSVPNGTSLEERIRRLTTHTNVGQSVKHAIKRRVGHEAVQSAAAHPHEQFFSLKALQKTLRDNGWNVHGIAGAAAYFKEFYYLFGRLFLPRGSSTFHALDHSDDKIAPHLPLSWADGWLIEARPFDQKFPLVLQVVTTLEAGGAEHLVHELAMRLHAKKFRVHTVSIFGGGPVESAFVASKSPLTVFERRGWFETYRRLRDLIRREHPEIVHTHLFGADVLGRIAAFRCRVPTIVSTEHNVNPDHGPVKRLVKRALAPITSAFIAVSEEVKTYMSKREGIPAKKIRVIPNGIDLTQVIPREPGPFRDVPRLITVGRLAPQKDHETLLKALAFIKRPWKLEIVGTGELQRPLEELAERLGIASRVHWLGFRTDVPQLLAHADLFCFPSRWEGLGLALLEAAAAGVPVIASDLPVFREVLPDSQATYVPAGDVPIWSATIERLIADSIPAVRSAYEATLDIREKFSLETMVDSYAKLYRKLL